MKHLFRIATVALLAQIGTQASAQTAQKIGYTNVEYILGQMPELKAIETEIKTKEAQYQNLIQQKQKELQDKVANYQKNQATMSDVIKTDMEKQLQNLNQSLQEFQQNAQTELQQKQQQLLAPVLQKIDKAIQETAKENGFTFVISSDLGNPSLSPVLLYVDEQYNLTDLVFKKLGVTPKPVTAAAPGKGAPAATTKPAPTTPKKN